MENIYWSHNGKYQEEVEPLNKKMPSIGMTNNQHLNLFIQSSNIYYDVYNNGGINIREKDIEENILKFSKDIPSVSRLRSSLSCKKRLKNKEFLEKFMDEVILFVKDKDLSYDRHAIYYNYETEQLSLKERDDFQEVSFGNAEEYNDWVKHRVDKFGYTFIQD